MENKETKKPVDKQLNEFMYRVGYTINETPRYKQIIDDEFDEIPQVHTATQDGQPVPNAGNSDAYLEEAPEVPEENPAELPGPEATGPIDPVAEPTNAPEPQNVDVEELPAEDPTAPPQVDVAVDAELPAEEPVAEPGIEEPAVDELQNEIIRHNTEAMKMINAKLGDLDSLMDSINSQMGVLNDKVEEVEEPTNAEKLMSKKDVSYPYYFNLNDFWNGSFFEQEREKTGEKGIRELPDGTFIADFDDLPLKSDIDIKDSFNDIV